MLCCGPTGWIVTIPKAVREIFNEVQSNMTKQESSLKQAIQIYTDAKVGIFIFSEINRNSISFFTEN